MLMLPQSFVTCRPICEADIMQLEKAESPWRAERERQKEKEKVSECVCERESEREREKQGKRPNNSEL